MIEINLIPPALRKNGGESQNAQINLPKDVLIGVTGGFILLLLVVHLLLGAVWLLGMGRLAQYNAHWETMSADKAILDGIHSQTGDTKKKAILISSMTVDKMVLWAPKFNAISDALPKGLWIRKMTLDKDGLTIEGSVVSKNESEINNVDRFLSSLRANDLFMKGFISLEVNSIQRGNNDSIEVTDFTVMAKKPEEPSATKSK